MPATTFAAVLSGLVYLAVITAAALFLHACVRLLLCGLAVFATKRALDGAVWRYGDASASEHHRAVLAAVLGALTATAAASGDLPRDTRELDPPAD